MRFIGLIASLLTTSGNESPDRNFHTHLRFPAQKLLLAVQWIMYKIVKSADRIVCLAGPLAWDYSEHLKQMFAFLFKS